MGRTKEQARQWLIRKLGGYVEPQIVRTEYRHVRSDLEHLRHKLIFSREESSYVSPEYIRGRMVNDLAKHIVGKVNIKRSDEETNYLGEVVIYEADLWVCFDPPVPTMVDA